MFHSSSKVSRNPASAFIPQIWPALIASGSAATAIGMGWLRLPFDVARTQYARSVQAGLCARSILASRDLEHALGLAEQLTLGPLARRL